MPFRALVPAMLALLLSSSCGKEPVPAAASGRGPEIVLSVGCDSLEVAVDTKTSAVTAVPSSLYWEMTTGSIAAGDEEGLAHSSTLSTLSSGRIATGIYQTADPTWYNYIVASVPIVFYKWGSYITVSNDSDVVCGRNNGYTSGYSTTPTIALYHVFARTGALTVTSSQGYAVSDVVWTIESKEGGTGGTGGDFDIRAGRMRSGSLANITPLERTEITSSSDLYLNAGEYTVTVSCTLTSTDPELSWSRAYSQSADVTFTRGYVHNLSATITTKVEIDIEITATISSDWSSTSYTYTETI